MSRSTTLTDWKDPDHEFYYPDPDSTIPDDQKTLAPGKAHLWNPQSDLSDKLNHALKWKSETFGPAKKTAGSAKKSMGSVTKTTESANISPFPARIGLQMLDNGAPIVATNHFDLELPKGKHAVNLYHYKIQGLERYGLTKKKIKKLFTLALDQWNFLHREKENFSVATSTQTIISWKSLDPGNEIEQDSIETTNPNEPKPGDEYVDTITDGKRSYNATLLFVGEVGAKDLEEKSDFADKARTTDVSDVENCLNIVISKAFDNRVFHTDQNKFYVRSARQILKDRFDNPSTSLETVRGYYFAVKPGMGKTLLNFNVTTSAFFRPILVNEFLADKTTFPKKNERLALLQRLRVFVDLERENESLNEIGARVKSIKGFSSIKIGDLTFHKNKKTKDGKFEINPDGSYIKEEADTNVADYLDSVFKSPISDREDFAVNVGGSSKGDEVWYAKEHLRILPFQLYKRTVPDHLSESMIKMAAHPPEEMKRLIECEGLKMLGFDATNKDKKKFRNNVPLSLHPTMFHVPSSRLSFPEVSYGGDSSAFKQSGWNMKDNHTFYDTIAKGCKYFILHARGCQAQFELVDSYESAFRAQVCNRLNIKDSSLTKLNSPDESLVDDTNLEKTLENAKRRGADLVLLILPSFDRGMYSKLKQLGDCKFDLHTICMTLKRANLSKYMTNVAMKVNFKLGGYTTKVEDLAKMTPNTCILGADVIHPGPAALEGCPSIASIVGSINTEQTTYRGSMRLQSKDKSDREIIDSAQEMFHERILDWARANGNKVPQNIIYFRDGVSEGQYAAVKKREVSMISKAVKTVKDLLGKMSKMGAQNTRILAVVGGKRHHTRFFPTEARHKDDRGNANCMPGTLVDRLVTSPYYNDFYLQSHSSFQGTAKPTHYFVIHDDKILGVAPNTLPMLIHRLCYAYCRSTNAVSYASPTYYADRLCERGRLYIPNSFNGTDDKFKKQLECEKNNFMTQKQKDRNQEFRMSADVDHNTRTDGEKSKDELTREKSDREDVRKRIREMTLEYVKKEFYKEKIGDETDEGKIEQLMVGNPWKENVGKVMFWM